MSTKINHTPGPWRHIKGNTYFEKLGKLYTGDLIESPDHNWLAAVWQNKNVDTQEANARLIAAAPDLYALRAAIAKAGG